jgi:ketosteroid isomerase-like protein
MHRPILFSLLICAVSVYPLAAQSNPVAIPAAAGQAAPCQAAPGFDALAQLSNTTSSPVNQPTLTPGVLLLLELEGRFSKAVAAEGGKAFGAWFADEAVTLNNGRPAVLGRAAIAAQAQWDPKTYQLTWVPQGAQMGPSNDMGFTWGHYEGRSKDKNGEPVVITGRYFTVWKKVPDGSWKVALDASANEPPNAGECCVLPKP